MQSLAEVFAPNGPLHSRLPDFSYREAQHRMAELIWQTFESHSHAAIEAGTGIGKTYAYLIPVLLSGRRAILSTGTKTLQDQLFTKDLPALGAAIGRPTEVAVLKGRNNYLCWHRLGRALEDPLHSHEDRSLLRALDEWGGASSNGDLSSLDDLQDRFALRARVTSTVDNCLGAQCEDFDRCFVAEARRRAQAASIVIVNHHLLLADLELKEAGFGELLGDAETVIVDEAHLLPDIAQQFFGVSVSTREMEALSRDALAECLAARLDRRAEMAVDDVAREAARLREAARSLRGRVPWHAIPPPLIATASDCAQVIDAAVRCFAGAEDTPPGIARCRERFEELASKLRLITDFDGEDGLRWLEVAERSLSLHWTPLDFGASLAARIREQGGNWIFTSATLAVNEDFDHFLSRLGLSDVATEVLPSPFDYANNARVYLPQGLPDPRHPEFVDRLMGEIWPLIEATRGGAFILFTSYRALNEAEAWLLARSAPGPVLVQGARARSQLLEEFRLAGDAVLLGTSSFWQGVDVRGHALRLVVIEKLPFAAPSDPLVEARSEAIRRDGGDPFVTFQLPQAVIALKQGVGRLIRDYNDRGLIVIGDPRLRTRPYGRVFLDSLPPAPRIDEFEEALGFARSLRPVGVSEGPEEHELARN